jgi:hypothetical protein
MPFSSTSWPETAAAAALHRVFLARRELVLRVPSWLLNDGARQVFPSLLGRRVTAGRGPLRSTPRVDLVNSASRLVTSRSLDLRVELW